MNFLIASHWSELDWKAKTSAIMAAVFAIIVLSLYVFSSMDLASQLSHASSMLGDRQMNAFLEQPLISEGLRVYHVARQQRLSESLGFLAFSFTIIMTRKSPITAASALLSLAIALYFFLRSNDLFEQTMMNTDLGVSGVHPTPPGLTLIVTGLLIFFAWSRVKEVSRFRGLGAIATDEKRELTLPSILLIAAILVPFL